MAGGRRPQGLCPHTLPPRLAVSGRAQSTAPEAFTRSASLPAPSPMAGCLLQSYSRGPVLNFPLSSENLCNQRHWEAGPAPSHRPTTRGPCLRPGCCSPGARQGHPAFVLSPESFRTGGSAASSALPHPPPGGVSARCPLAAMGEARAPRVARLLVGVARPLRRMGSSHSPRRCSQGYWSPHWMPRSSGIREQRQSP